MNLDLTELLAPELKESIKMMLSQMAPMSLNNLPAARVTCSSERVTAGSLTLAGNSEKPCSLLLALLSSAESRDGKKWVGG